MLGFAFFLSFLAQSKCEVLRFACSISLCAKKTATSEAKSDEENRNPNCAAWE